MAISQTQAHTFMLLPTFDFHPDTSPIMLGAILGRARKQTASPTSSHSPFHRPPPDPRRPFTRRSNTVPIPEDASLKSVTLRDFHVALGENSTNGAGIFADSSLLSIVGGKVSGDRQRVHKLEIDCRAKGRDVTAATPSAAAADVVDSLVPVNTSGGQAVNKGNVVPGETIVERTTFEPSKEYISKAIEASMLAQGYMERDWWKGSKRSVFLVTGLMVVRGAATISSWDTKSTSGAIEGKVDLAGVTGGTVPLGVGVSVNRGDGHDSKREYTVDGPFILAYQLRRVRVNKKGRVTKDEDFNSLALLNTNRSSSITLASNKVTLDDILKSNDEDDSESDSDDSEGDGSSDDSC